MPEPEQQPVPSFSRPSARPIVNRPIQRSSYGVPPRQSMQPISQPQAVPAPQAPQPTAPATPRYMDVSAPALRPQPVAQPVVSIEPVQQSAPAIQSLPETPQPASSPAFQAQAPLPQSAVPKPLFSSQPAPPKPVKKSRQVLRYWRTAMLGLAIIFCLLGVARWATAGTTSGFNIAAGAVKANDGHTMTVQFVANDGQMHKFTDKSKAELIPGSPVEVAYRSGAADTSAKQVSLIRDARSLGVSIFLAGVILLALYGIIEAVHKIRNRNANAPLTTTVTA